MSFSTFFDEHKKTKDFINKSQETKDTTKILKEDKKEEERSKASEQEEKDYEKYLEEYNKQHAVIDSYEKLLIKKEEEETRKRLDQYMKQIKTRAGRLRAQGKKAHDKYGKTASYYTDVWNAIKSGSPAFLNGDLYRQHDLLEFLVSEDDDIRNPEEVIHDLITEFPEIADWS